MKGLRILNGRLRWGMNKERELGIKVSGRIFWLRACCMVVYNTLFRCRGLKYFWPDWCQVNGKLRGPDSAVPIIGWEWAYL